MPKREGWGFKTENTGELNQKRAVPQTIQELIDEKITFFPFSATLYPKIVCSRRAYAFATS